MEVTLIVIAVTQIFRELDSQTVSKDQLRE